MSIQKDWLKDMEIIIETDSKNAWSWVNNREDCPWNLSFHCNKLNNMLQILKIVTSVHKNSDTNFFANALAIEGSHLDGAWQSWT